MLTSPTSKTFFFGVTRVESSSAWRSAWQEGWRLLHCQSVQNIVVDHLEAETGGRWWSREEIASILKVLSGEVKAEEENSDLPLHQVSQPLLFTNLKCYSLDFPWETLRFLDPPLSWRFPLVQDHPCSHLTSRLGKDLSEEGEISVVWGGLLYQWKSWFLFHSPHHLSVTLWCFSSWRFTMCLWVTAFLFSVVFVYCILGGRCMWQRQTISSDIHMPSWSFQWPLPDISGEASAPFYEGGSSAPLQG